MNVSPVLAASLVTMLAACGGGQRAHAAPPPAAPVNVTSAPQVTGAWEKLGERVVNGRVDHDVVHVGRQDGRFTAIEVRVDGNTVEMFDIVVSFGNGEKFSPPTRLLFDKNTRSRVIDLPGEKRFIQRVDFKYGKLPGEGRAAVELWGKSV